MPEEQSDSRRRFLGFAIGGIAGALTLGYAVPLVSYLIKPSLKKTEEPWSLICCTDGLAVDEPKSVTFRSQYKSGWEEEKVEHDVWVVKKPDGAFTVYSPVCPHLGCGYHWNDATQRFECPCHASVYDINGKVLGGPAPRPLDTLPTKIEDGNLYVKYEKFRLGISEKVTA